MWNPEVASYPRRGRAGEYDYKYEEGGRYADIL